MRRIGIGREHRAENGGLIQENPELVLLIVLGILTAYLSVLKGQEHSFFDLGIIASIIYTSLVVLFSIMAFIVVQEWLKRRNVALGVAVLIVFLFVFIPEVVGEFLLSVFSGP